MSGDSESSDQDSEVPERFRAVPEAYAKLRELARAIGRQLAQEEFERARHSTMASKPTCDDDEGASNAGQRASASGPASPSATRANVSCHGQISVNARGKSVMEVVYLKKGERAPRSKNVAVIEVVSDRSQEAIESGPHGLKLRVNKSNFDSVLADLQLKAGPKTQTRIYVKGMKP